MNKIPVKIPFGTKFVSDMEDYVLPKGHCIVDKGVTGCGYTEFCLRNSQPVVLCSPRKLLLENKNEQHQKEGNWNVLYLENNIEDYSGVKNWRQQIYSHLQKCQGTPFTESRVPKFMVTYDSLKHVVDCFKSLGVDSGEYCFVVDEFQSIFLDAFFKAGVEFDFVEYLQGCPNVIYLSATPMLDRYLCDVDEFKDLDFYELDWSETGSTENVKVFGKKIDSVSGECAKIVKKYLGEQYPIAVDLGGGLVESREAVFYLNSVGDITRVIRKTKLSPSQVNIICAGTKENQVKLDKLSRDLKIDISKGFKIGRVPLKGETNKMFTFCTRSVYMGADFYSDSASSYVFANPNVKCLALDISLDLPQIVGRQRNRSNPFKNQISVFYKTNDQIITKEEFNKLQEERDKATDALLELYQKATTDLERQEYLHKLRDSIQVSQYKRDFVSISSKTGQPVYNNFVKLAHKRSWEVAQKDYQDRISVTTIIQKQGYSLQDNQGNDVIKEFIEVFEGYTEFTDRLRVYCGYLDNYSDDPSLAFKIRYYVKDPDYQKFYDFFGTKGCSSESYQRGDLEKKMKDVLKAESHFSDIQNSFVIGMKYTLKEIKTMLSDLYKLYKLKKAPKATDLEEYFNVKLVRIPNPETGKKDKGYLIVSKKA